MAQALLLSETAEFDSKPELEIFADDVVCGHGATSGQIDDDLLFYLESRGLPEPEARHRQAVMCKCNLPLE
jgi:Fe-S cluster assembly protein SufD